MPGDADKVSSKGGKEFNDKKQVSKVVVEGVNCHLASNLSIVSTPST